MSNHTVVRNVSLNNEDNIVDAGRSLSEHREAGFVSIMAQETVCHLVRFCWRSICTLECAISTLLVCKGNWPVHTPMGYGSSIGM